LAAVNGAFALIMESTVKQDLRPMNPIGLHMPYTIAICVYLGSTAIRSKHWIGSLIVGAVVVSLAMALEYPVFGWSGPPERFELSMALGDLNFTLFECSLLLNAAIIVVYCEHHRWKRRREQAVRLPTDGFVDAIEVPTRR